jgi:hypothetical protein
MTFFMRAGWYVQFLGAGLSDPANPGSSHSVTLPRSGSFLARVRQLSTQDARDQLAGEIENGRGGVYLYLTPEQYRNLR